MKVTVDGKMVQGTEKFENKVPQRGNRVFSEEQKAKVAYMLAVFTPIVEIRKHLEKEMDRKINDSSLTAIRDNEKWGIVIKNIRKEWLAKVGEVPISNKRIRLEAYQKMMEKGFDFGQMNIVKSALDGARSEMENRMLGGNNYSLTYVQTLSDQDLMNKRSEILEKLRRIKLDEPKEIENIEEAEFDEEEVKLEDGVKKDE